MTTIDEAGTLIDLYPSCLLIRYYAAETPSTILSLGSLGAGGISMI